MWTHAGSRAGRQQDRAHGQLQEISEGTAGPRRTAVAWRARAADLREHLRAGVETLGGADEDDPQRVPPDAVAEGSPGPRRQAHGGFFLRRGRGTAARIRPPANEVISSHSHQLSAESWTQDLRELRELRTDS